jgi:hypothetical protein
MKKLNRTTKNFSTVVAAATVLAVFGTGTAVAGGLITSAKIKNNTVKSIDVRNNSLKSVDVTDGSLTGADLANSSVTGADIANGSLTNQDVGVLFAQVNSNATVANSSGNVTATSLGTGLYEVDFGRDISDCAATATVGTPDVGGAQGVVTQLNERSGNAEGLWVRTADEADTTLEQDLPFQVLVVC